MSTVSVYSAHLTDPRLGTLKLWATDQGLRRLDFRGGLDITLPGEHYAADAPPPALAMALDALREYLAGERRTFEIPLDLGHVTPFRRRVYDRLLDIPFGHVKTYGDIARELDEGVGASRAVGQAVGANPIGIVIPCHRVVASNGTLHGFSGGLSRKATLLRLEGADVDGTSSRSRVHPEVLRLPL